MVGTGSAAAALLGSDQNRQYGLVVAGDGHLSERSCVLSNPSEVHRAQAPSFSGLSMPFSPSNREQDDRKEEEETIKPNESAKRVSEDLVRLRSCVQTP